MIQHTDHFHGSDLEKIEKAMGIKKEEIISFSANVNPLGLSDELKHFLSGHLDVITSYPDREYTKLREAIGSYIHCNPEQIIVGNGATELISLFLGALNPQKALIIGPTYSEYEREISLGGGTVHYYFTKEENHFHLDIADFLKEMEQGYDLVILCNPNNPTSTILTREELSLLLSELSGRHACLMVDETYAEFVENEADVSAVSLVNRFDNLLVLRGTAKFFAAPGLRLGYGIVGSSRLLSLIKEHKNPWTINSIAELAGCFMFQDQNFIKATRQLMEEERDFVCKRLSAINGLTVFPASCNFVLVKIEKEGKDADLLFEHCIKKKMMIRNCSSFPTLSNQYFRVCFMKHKDNLALIEAIEEAMA